MAHPMGWSCRPGSSDLWLDAPAVADVLFAAGLRQVDRTPGHAWIRSLALRTCFAILEVHPLPQ